MGNREDLLAGARQVIIERGVAKATAREIAAAAGVSLAAIGYHFGSKEQLLTEALNDALGSAIGDGMGALIRDGAGTPPLEAFARVWNGMPEIVGDNRAAMVASVENLVRVVRDPDAQQQMGAAVSHACADLADDLAAAHPQLSEEQALALGELSFVLAQGYAIHSLIATRGELPSGDRFAPAVSALVETEVSR